MDNAPLGQKEQRVLRAVSEVGLIKTDNPKGFFGKVTLTFQGSRIVHVEKYEGIKLD
jgi:hypothetical protein